MLLSLCYLHTILFVIVYEDYAPIKFDMTCDERTNGKKYKNDLQGALDFCRSTKVRHDYEMIENKTRTLYNGYLQVAVAF